MVDTSKDNMAVYSDGQTHCYACGTHGFVEHKEKVQVAETTKNKDWLVEYNRGDYHALPDRKLRAETLEKYKVKSEMDGKGKIIKHHYPNHNKKGEMVGVKTRIVANKQFFGAGKTDATNQLFGQSLFRAGGKFVTICEGELDAMASYEMFGSKFACVSVVNGSHGKFDRLK